MTAIDFSAFVNELASVSGETILPFFRTALSVTDKGHGQFDPVTAADHAAETAMRSLIRRSFPEHGIVGEEFGADRADAEYVWVLDPIDGTKSFISGMPAWGTLIALTRFGEPVFGMMNQPFIGERFSGDGGRRALSRAGRRPRPAGARLRDAGRGGAVHHQPAADERGRPQGVPARSKRPCGCRATAAIATPTACWPPAMSISSSRPSSSPTTSSRWCRSSPAPAA